jgi:hypothetical protein
VTLDALERREVQKALAAMEKGGYVEALARTAFLIGHENGGEPLPLSRLEMRQELADEYAELLPQIAPFEWRTIRGEQEIIARHDPERALATLPLLLADEADRARFLTLLERIASDRRIQEAIPSAGQIAMLERIQMLLTRRGRAAAPLARRPAHAAPHSRKPFARAPRPESPASGANGKRIAHGQA